MKRTLIALFCLIFLPYNIVFADDFLDTDFTDKTIFEVSSKIVNEPSINSKNAIVLDRNTLTPLYEKNSNAQVPMASTTKILTCIIALENCNKNEIVTVSSKSSSVNGSTLGLKTNMKISINDLLYGLMLRSGNDCAIAIAEHISGSVENFSTLMNSKAFELGLLNSNFVTPHGLDNQNHYTTAYDLAILTDYALKNPDFKKIVSTKIATISFNGYPREISNTNELLGNIDGVYGVKTGFTFEAGRCLVSSCIRNNLDIIVVVLGADTKSMRTKDSKNLIDYIFSNYNYIDVSNVIDKSFSTIIPYFNNYYNLYKTTTIPILKLEKLENYNFPLKETDISNLKTKIYIQKQYSSTSVPQNIVGKLELYNNQKLLCSSLIILENKLEPNSWLFYFRQALYKYK